MNSRPSLTSDFIASAGRVGVAEHGHPRRLAYHALGKQLPP